MFVVPRWEAKTMVDLIQGVFLTYVAIVIGIALYSYKEVDDIGDLLVADWNLNLLFVTASLTASLFTAAYFFSALGLGYRNGGWEATATILGLGVTMILGSLIWTKPLRRLRGWTMSDYFYLRYGKNKVIGAYAGILEFVAFNIFLIGAYTAGSAYIVSAALNIDYVLAVFIIAGLAGFYSILGGLWAVAYTDLFQATFALIGITVTAILVVADVGWGTVTAASHWDTSHLFTANGALFWSSFLVLAIGDMPAADLGQRAAAADSPNTARRGMLYAGIILCVVGFLPGMFSAGFQQLYPSAANGERLLVTFIDQRVAAQIHPLVAGLFLSALGAASMSSIDSAYVAGAGCLIKNVYMDWFNSDPDQAKVTWYARILIAISAIAGGLMAAYFQRAVGLAYLTFDLIFVTLTWPLVFGVFQKNVSAKGVITSITVGIVTYVGVTLFGNPFVPSVNPESFAGLIVALWDSPWAVGVVANFIALQIGSYIWPPSEESLDAYDRQHNTDFDDQDTSDMFGVESGNIKTSSEDSISETD